MAGKSDADKLRAAAEWFDTVDKLLSILKVTVAATGETYMLIDKIGAGREIQDDLLRIANALETTTTSTYDTTNPVRRPGRS